MNYLGETTLDIHKTKYAMYAKTDWILLFIDYYNFDGEHHKAWLIDQIFRITLGTKVIVKEAKWDNGEKEKRFYLDEPSEEYKDWLLINPDHNLGIAP
jgi:hypothetical protein